MEGLVKPSALSVSLMLASLLVFILAFVFGSQQLMQAGQGHLFATNRYDSDAFVTSELERLKDIPTEKPLLAISGASVTYSSFGTEEEIARDYKARFGTDVDVALLSSGRMPLTSSIMILDHLPKNRPVIAVLGVGPSRFTMPSEEVTEPFTTTRFGTSSPAELELRKELGVPAQRETGFLVVDHGGFYIVRLWAFFRNVLRLAITGHGVIRDDERYIGLTASDRFKELRANAVVERFDHSDKARVLNEGLLEKAISLAKSRPNMQLYIVEHPINPSFVSEYLGEDRYARHLARMKALTARNDVPYWTIGKDLDLGESNFYDWAHISSEEAQGKLRRSLIDHLKQVQDD